MIPCQRKLFRIPEDVTYLNCAYMSPLMSSAAAAGETGFSRKLSPWEIQSEDFFTQAEQLRSAAAHLFASSADDIAIVPSASYGLATAALNLPVRRSQKILVLEEQFPSNFYPWKRLAEEKGAELCIVPYPRDGDWTSNVLASLEKDDIAIAALPQTHWTSGGLLDLLRISTASRLCGAALVLDLTQSLGAHPFDAGKIRPDFAVAATYKWLLGPYSLGIMYVAPQWQEGRPLEENWIQRANSRSFTELTQYTDSYDKGARRFDMGERSNFALLPCAIAAIEQLLHWDISEISATLGGLTRTLAVALSEEGFRPFPEAFRAPHYLCLHSERQLQNWMEALTGQKIYVSVRGRFMRVTPHLYNSEKDVHRLIIAVRKLR